MCWQFWWRYHFKICFYGLLLSLEELIMSLDFSHVKYKENNYIIMVSNAIRPPFAFATCFLKSFRMFITFKKEKLEEIVSENFTSPWQLDGYIRKSWACFLFRFSFLFPECNGQKGYNLQGYTLHCINQSLLSTL